MNPVHFQIVGTDLKFSKDVAVPLRSAISFRVKKHTIHQIEVECQDIFQGKTYETIFRLYLENKEQVQLCIDAFIQNTKMTPAFFFTRSVKPIVSPPPEEKTETTTPKEHAAIEFEFFDEDDSDCFMQYAAPQIPDFKAELKKASGRYFASLTCIVDERSDQQVDRIKKVFISLLNRFGDCGIYSSLLNCKDDRFSTQPIVHKSSDFERPPIEQRREFHVTCKRVFELFFGIQLKVELADLRTWFQDPASNREKSMIKCENYLKEKIRNAIHENDNAACKKWLVTAGTIPGLDMIRFLRGYSASSQPHLDDAF